MHRRMLRSPVSPKDRASLVILACFLLYCLFFALTPNIIGALTFGWYLSLIIEVPARQLYRFRFFSYRVSVAISAFVTFSLLIFGLSRIVPIVLEEGKRLFPLLRESVGSGSAPDFLSNSQLGREIGEVVQGATGNILERTAQFGVEVVNDLVRLLPDFATGLLIFIITAAYFTYLVPVFKTNMWRFFPRTDRPKAVHFVAEVYGEVRHFIAGQIMIALAVGVIAAAVPAIALGLGHGGLMGLLKVLLVLVLANQIESWILSPQIQGSRMKLNWFVIILAILVSGAIFGLVGVLIAIPLVVFFKKYWIWYVQDYFSKL